MNKTFEISIDGRTKTAKKLKAIEARLLAELSEPTELQVQLVGQIACLQFLLDQLRSSKKS